MSRSRSRCPVGAGSMTMPVEPSTRELLAEDGQRVQLVDARAAPGREQIANDLAVVSDVNALPARRSKSSSIRSRDTGRGNPTKARVASIWRATRSGRIGVSSSPTATPRASAIDGAGSVETSRVRWPASADGDGECDRGRRLADAALAADDGDRAAR